MYISFYTLGQLSFVISKHYDTTTYSIFLQNEPSTPKSPDFFLLSTSQKLTMKELQISRKKRCIIYLLSIFRSRTDGFLFIPYYPIRNEMDTKRTRFAMSQKNRGTAISKQSISPQKDEEWINSECNFWTGVRRRSPDPVDRNVPWYENLDLEGSLPDGCYTNLGIPSFAPKPTCRISLDLTGAQVDDETMTFLHLCIDNGFTTFQGGETMLYRVLHEQTPRTVMNQVNLVTTIRTPESLLISTRDAILAPLREIRSECIDTLQIQYNPKSPYFMEFLDMATELQREGLIRSIVGHQLPISIMRQAHEFGFQLDSNQIPMNILDPCQVYNTEFCSASKDTGTKIVVDSPLAGGLLSSRFLRIGEPYMYELTRSERLNLPKIQAWSKRCTPKHSDLWRTYQTNLIEILQDFALKYRVSIEAVALRWCLQQELVSSLVIPLDLRCKETEFHQVRIQQLRKVFSFNLKEEEMNQIWDVSGCVKPGTEQPLTSEEWDESMMYRKNGLYFL
jgi:diketogulonate reductase-like aldo/keto reductase